MKRYAKINIVFIFVLAAVLFHTVPAMAGSARRPADTAIMARPLSQSVAQPPVFDFDGDGKTDYGIARTTGGVLVWYLSRSTLGSSVTNWGAPTDLLVPADYDGDHKWDIAVWRPGATGIFYIMRSQTSTIDYVQLGQTGDDPRNTQDFDGDGKADPTVVRNVGGTLIWYTLNSLTGTVLGRGFGSASTDLATRGDFDGDLKADLAVYRTNSGSPANTFFVIRSSDGASRVQTWGSFVSDYVTPGDFDGDGKTDFAVWRGVSAGADGVWYWIQSSDGAFRALTYGAPGGDRPAPGDYDGDGKTDQATWRPGAQGFFWINRSLLGSTAVPWGTSGDTVLATNLQVR